MFEEGQILINKKFPERIVLIKDSKGTAYVLADLKNKRTGEIVVCSDFKFYKKADEETEKKYLHQKIKQLYKSKKPINIKEYL